MSTIFDGSEEADWASSSVLSLQEVTTAIVPTMAAEKTAANSEPWRREDVKKRFMGGTMKGSMGGSQYFYALISNERSRRLTAHHPR